MKKKIILNNAYITRIFFPNSKLDPFKNGSMKNKDIYKQKLCNRNFPEPLLWCTIQFDSEKNKQHENRL